MSLNQATSLHLRTMRQGETYESYVKRMRGADAVAQLNQAFTEKRHEIELEDARRSGRAIGIQIGHVQGWWWGFCCGACMASVVGALVIIGWALLRRGGPW